MKQTLLYKYLIIIILALAWTGQAWAWGENTSYLLEEASSATEVMTDLSVDKSREYSWSGPGKTLTFQYKSHSWSATGKLTVYAYTDANRSEGKTKVFESVSFWHWSEYNKWQSVEIDIENKNYHSLRFEASGTLKKSIIYVKVTRATTISSSSSLDFGTVHRITGSRDKSNPQNASVDYKFLKNKARVGLHINDLFNRDSRYRSAITATTRTEGGSTLLHHYASFTFHYNFEAKKSTKQ